MVRTSLAVRPRTSLPLRLAAEIERNVVLIKLTPNMSSEALARHLQGASGAVLEGTGVGHIRADLHPVRAGFNRPTVISTQTIQAVSVSAHTMLTVAFLPLPTSFRPVT